MNISLFYLLVVLAPCLCSGDQYYPDYYDEANIHPKFWNPKDTFDKIKNATGNVIDDIKGTVGDAVDSVNEQYNNIINKLVEVKDKFGCTLQGETCQCCSPFESANFCLEGTFSKANASLNLAMLWNGKSLVSKEMSAKKPNAICAPFPPMPVLKSCLQAYDISFDNGFFSCFLLQLKPMVINKGFDLNINCIRIKDNKVTMEKSQNTPNDGYINISLPSFRSAILE